MKLIESKFYCIQPIHIDIDSLSILFESKLDLKKIRSQEIKEINKLPKWKRIMDDLSNLYSSIIVLNYDIAFNSTLLKLELKNNNFLINSNIDLSRYLDTNDTNIYLLFDYRLLQFIIIYEINFSIPINELDALLQTTKDKLDFYNVVRNIFVKEEEDSLVLSHIADFKKDILRYIQRYISMNLDISIPINNLSILNNSGNITNIITMDKLNNIEYNKYAELFIKLNSFAERIPNNNLPISLDNIDNNKNDYNSELYYFNGRFHTITLHSKKNEYRYIPIQFQMQYLWFYLSKQINLILEKYNDDILYDDSISKITQYNDKMDLIINKVEILNIFNQKFKLSIEADSKIYYSIENKWNIENMIHGSNKYIQFFKDYLNRLYIKKTSKLEQRQNKILLFITLFQFIALLSVWNDYLSLLDDSWKEKASKIIPLFKNYHNFEIFNYYLPMGFITVILLMLIYIYQKKE